VVVFNLGLLLMRRDELDEQGGLGWQGTARYKLRRGSTDSSDGVGEQESEERVREREGARGGREEGTRPDL
jgi:hypothetical protein